jgi:hypothetical protein
VDPARKWLTTIGRGFAGSIVLGVWAFDVTYTTVYSGSTSWWIHIGAGIILAALYPESFEDVRSLIEEALPTTDSSDGVEGNK